MMINVFQKILKSIFLSENEQTKEILEKLNKDFLSDNLSLGQKSLREILTSYSEIKFVLSTQKYIDNK